MNSSGRWVSNMLLQKSREIAPERKKRLNQSKNNAQLWMCLGIKVKSDSVKKNGAQKSGMLGPWSWWWTGRPGVLQSMGSQRVGLDWATELSWTELTLIHGPNIPGSCAILFFIASDFTSITSYLHTWLYFRFGSISSSFLELFLHSSPVAYWAPSDLGSSSFSALSFCLFILFVGFSRQEYWSGLPFLSPVDHVLSGLYTVTHLSWVALCTMAHSFIALDKAVVHVINLVSFLWLWFSFCLPSDG